MESDLFLHRWKEMRARTRAMLEACGPSIRGFSPSADARSIGSIAAHIVGCEATVITGLETGTFSWAADLERFEEMSWEALLESARDLDARLVQMVRSADLAWFEGVPPGYTLSRQRWLWETLEHEIHHVGQLALLVRLAGGEPAKIFG